MSVMGGSPKRRFHCECGLEGWSHLYVADREVSSPRN